MNDISNLIPMFTIREENLVTSTDVPMVSYMKVRNKGKKNMKILCKKIAIETLHSVHDPANVNIAHNNFIIVIDNLFCKYCPIIIIKSPKNIFQSS